MKLKGLLPDAIGRRLDPVQRYGLRSTLFAIAVLLVAVPFAVLVVDVVRQGPVVRLDRAGAERVQDLVHRSPAAIDVARAVTFLGKPAWWLALVAAAALLLVRRGSSRLALFLAVTSAGGALVNSAVKVAVNRPRPSPVDPVATAYGDSFPSGHAMASVVVYGSLLLVFLPALGRRGRLPAAAGTVVLALAIGCSRLALGVHYLSDVVAGWVLGVAWLSASVAAFSIWRQETGHEAVEPLDGLEPESATGPSG